jgi:hypothetical protein
MRNPARHNQIADKNFDVCTFDFLSRSFEISDSKGIEPVLNKYVAKVCGNILVAVHKGTRGLDPFRLG